MGEGAKRSKPSLAIRSCRCCSLHSMEAQSRKTNAIWSHGSIVISPETQPAGMLCTPAQQQVRTLHVRVQASASESTAVRFKLRNPLRQTHRFSRMRRSRSRSLAACSAASCCSTLLGGHFDMLRSALAMQTATLVQNRSFPSCSAASCFSMLLGLYTCYNSYQLYLCFQSHVLPHQLGRLLLAPRFWVSIYKHIIILYAIPVPCEEQVLRPQLRRLLGRLLLLRAPGWRCTESVVVPLCA